MELFDTHCHIQSAGAESGERTTRKLWAKSDSNIDEIIARAGEHGVKQMICVGCDLSDSELAIDCVRTRENMYASIGIHPHEAETALAEGHLDAFAALLGRPPAEAVAHTGSKPISEDGPLNSKIVAIGECGLDYFYTNSPKEAQIEVLEFQLQLAQQHNLPLIFHVREALDDFWPIFDKYPGLRGVLHSFTDTEQQLQQALRRGLYIGVNGIATFAKQPEQLAMYRAIPLENLLLETDAPFLTPIPYRGTICEPYHVRTTADFLSNFRGETMESLTRATTRNARQLFNVT